MKTKTFLLTLALFLLFFYAGILTVCQVTYQSDYNNIKNRCLGEHYFITGTLAKDIAAVTERGTVAENAVATLMRSYAQYYQNQNVSLALFKNGLQLYSNLPPEEAPAFSAASPEPGTRTVLPAKGANNRFISISGALPEPLDEYQLVYYYRTDELAQGWNHLTRLLIGIGAVFSILLAACLNLLLMRLFRPLREVSAASKRIAGGEYANRLRVKGHDEVAEMAENFNHMAEEIGQKISDLADAAEQRQEFIDNFAHELRTPMTTIYGYAEYLQKAAASEEERISAAGYIMSESRRLQNMSARLLELALLRSDGLHLTELRLKELFDRAEMQLQTKLNDKKIMLETAVDKQTICGDPDLLSSLLLNLLENAAKACPEGGRIRLTAVFTGETTVIAVEDNGKGMSKEQLAHITEPFYRTDKARSRAEGGAGLGLALCERIAAAHGASLSFSSTPGKGTTATITFYNSDISL